MLQMLDDNETQRDGDDYLEYQLSPRKELSHHSKAQISQAKVQ